MKKRGISLIVLIVTIIVIIILAAAVILTTSKNNPIESSKEARFKEDIRTFQDELAMYISKEYTSKAGQRDNKITATEYSKDGSEKSVYTYLSSFSKKYEEKIIIQDDEIVYSGSDKKEKEWVTSLRVGIVKKLTINYKNGEGETIKPSEEKILIGVGNVFKAPEIEGYVAQNEEEILEEGKTEITFIYYGICNTLAYEGLDASGRVTTVESNIVSYSIKSVASDFNSKYIAIPEEYNGKPITKIGDNAFNNNKIIEGIAFSKNIKVIGSYAFSGSRLKELNVPSTVESIGFRAFGACPNLKKAKVNSKNIGGSQVFGWSSNLEEIEIGKNVTNTGSDTFQACSKLKKVTIKSENLTIGTQFPRSVTSLTVNEDNASYIEEDGVIYSKSKDYILLCIPSKTGKFVVPSTVKTIGVLAFNGSNISEVEIPSNVENVGNRAFGSCSNLVKAKVNSKNIGGSQVFGWCSNLEEVEIGNNVKNAGSCTFQACGKLKEVNYLDTKSNWSKILSNSAFSDSSVKKIICTDGEINR